MNWSIIKSIFSVHLGILTLNGFSMCEPPRSILALHAGNVRQDAPVGENSAMVSIFLNQFVKVDNYPVTDFRTPGLGTLHQKVVVE